MRRGQPQRKERKEERVAFAQSEDDRRASSRVVNIEPYSKVIERGNKPLRKNPQFAETQIEDFFNTDHESEMGKKQIRSLLP
jgi:hypothetical protein